MNKEHLKLFVEQNPKLVKMTESNSRPGIFVLKYTRRVFYDNLWSDELEHCRGAIVDKDFNLISYPFKKIYNYQIEDRAPVLADDARVTAYRKVNGFMVACTWYRDDVLISTTGSTDSPYVAMAREMIGDNLDRYRKICREYLGNTFMFECVHESDPHIVPEQPGMYLLGMRKNEWCSPIEANAAIMMLLQNAFRTRIVQSFYTSMGQLLEEVKTVKHEGFVFYTDDGNVSSKLKSPYYLTAKWVARNPRTDKLLTNQFREQIDEEYYPLLDHIRNNIDTYTVMDEQARLTWVRNYLEAECQSVIK
jgi:hypothetical protein